jgi:hypothetical protein
MQEQRILRLRGTKGFWSDAETLWGHMWLDSIIHRPHQGTSVRYYKTSVRPYNFKAQGYATGQLEKITSAT